MQSILPRSHCFQPSLNPPPLELACWLTRPTMEQRDAACWRVFDKFSVAVHHYSLILKAVNKRDGEEVTWMNAKWTGNIALRTFRPKASTSHAMEESWGCSNLKCFYHAVDSYFWEFIMNFSYAFVFCYLHLENPFSTFPLKKMQMWKSFYDLRYQIFITIQFHSS